MAIATGIGIDPDLDDVAAVGKGLRRRHADMGGIVLPGAMPASNFAGSRAAFCDFENIEAQIESRPHWGGDAVSECNVLC